MHAPRTHHASTTHAPRIYQVLCRMDYKEPDAKDFAGEPTACSLQPAACSS